MSRSAAHSNDGSPIELGSAFSWPHIIAGLCLFVVPALVGVPGTTHP